MRGRTRPHRLHLMGVSGPRMGAVLLRGLVGLPARTSDMHPVPWLGLPYPRRHLAYEAGDIPAFP